MTATGPNSDSSSSSSSLSNIPGNTLPTLFSSSATSVSSPTHIHQTFSIKPTSKNYIAWKLQFTPLLKFYNLYGILNGTESPPAKEIVNSSTNKNELNPAYVECFNKDQILFSWLLSSITEELYSHLVGLNSSSEVWAALASAYGVVSQAKGHNVKSQ